MIRKSRVSRKIRLKIRFPGIETRFAAKPSVGRIEKNSFFFFLRSQDSTFEEERFEDSTRTSFSNSEFCKTFLLETNIEYQKISRRFLFEFSRRENVLGMQNTFGSETLLKVVSREYFSQINELVASQTRVAQK